MAAIALSVAAASALFIAAGTTTEALAYSALFGFGVGGLLSVPPVIYADYYGRRSLGAIRGVGRTPYQLRTSHRRRAVRARYSTSPKATNGLSPPSPSSPYPPPPS